MKLLLRTRRILKRTALSLLITAGFVILCFNESWRIPRNGDGLEAVGWGNHQPVTDAASNQNERRISTIECKHGQRTCLINNLHLVNGSFAVFLGPGFNASGMEDLHMFTGIGWGTGYFRFHFKELGSWQGDTLQGLSLQQRPVSNDTLNQNKRFVIPIHIHASNPPNYINQPHQYISEPTIFYSVLWPNLFRTIYAAYASWYTLMDYKIFFPDHHRVVLVDRSPEPAKFLSIVQSVTPSPVASSSSLLKGVYIFKAAAVGLSRDALIAEIVLERGKEWRFALRQKALTLFCATLKTGLLNGGKFVQVPAGKLRHDVADVESRRSLNLLNLPREWSKRPRVTLVLRESNTPRQILNEGEVISALRKLPIHLSVHKFGGLSLLDQVRVMDGTDIFITMHGAAVTHLLFLNSRTVVIELFPFEFKKVIYQNLAAVVGVKYMYWQNQKESQTRFDWNTASKSRVTNMTEDRITRLPIDWYNMDSKNYWRNQDTVVSAAELGHVVKRAISEWSSVDATKYLMFMPWEQMNNQLIGFKSACAVAKMLDRTLVLPHLGYKAPKNATQESSEFKVSEYVWHNFEHYFDLETLVKHLPCDFITFDNFYSLNQNRALPVIRYHHLGDNKTSESQFREYYKSVAKLTFEKVEWDVNAYFQLSKAQILSLHASDEKQVLALGSLYWYYDFGHPVQYPLTHVQDYMKNPEYERISRSLSIHERIQRAVKMDMKQAGLLDEKYVAVHVRRGDYSEKCRELENNGDAKERCMTSLEFMRSRLTGILSAKAPGRVLFISTNADEAERRRLRQGFSSDWYTVLFQEDIRRQGGVEHTFDGGDSCFYDQVIASKAQYFVGNMFSSFTRHVLEMRNLTDLKSDVF
ncbi:hypothetical protein HDU77_000043 [Chytriomyces hyalinus]|nr:hypothetical protein HDU77_000043 [Chytriomyces hyalinus]